MEWIVALIVVIIVIALVAFREQFAGVTYETPAAENVSASIANVQLPAHNSGKPSMWLPAGLQPQYYWRDLTWVE